MSIEKEILSSSRVVAVVGLSPKTDRPSHRVANYLKKNGYKIIPVNPQAEKMLGKTCYPDLGSIPEPVDVLSIVEEAIQIGAKAVWMQEGVVNEEAAARARFAGLQVVMDRCVKKEHEQLQN